MACQKSQAHGRPASIAVIDGRSIASHTRIFEGRGLVRKIKDRGLSNFMYYCGAFEYLIHRDIPSEAIIGSFNIAELLLLSEQNADVAGLMQIETLQRKGQTNTIFQSLEPMVLDSSTARAVAALSRLINKDIHVHHPLVKDFMNVLAQNYRLPASEDWLANMEFAQHLHLSLIHI